MHKEISIGSSCIINKAKLLYNPNIRNKYWLEINLHDIIQYEILNFIINFNLKINILIYIYLIILYIIYYT